VLASPFPLCQTVPFLRFNYLEPKDRRMITSPALFVHIVCSYLFLPYPESTRVPIFRIASYALYSHSVRLQLETARGHPVSIHPAA
jgi:hypothetical protein